MKNVQKVNVVHILCCARAFECFVLLFFVRLILLCMWVTCAAEGYANMELLAGDLLLMCFGFLPLLEVFVLQPSLELNASSHSTNIRKVHRSLHFSYLPCKLTCEERLKPLVVSKFLHSIILRRLCKRLDLQDSVKFVTVPPPPPYTQ